MSDDVERDVPGLRWPLGMAFIVPTLTAGAYFYASLSEARRVPHNSGFQSRGKKIFIFFGDLLGQTGSLVVGGLLTAGAFVWLYVTVKKRQRIGSPRA